MSASPRNPALALIYAATIFVSAFLLFQIQPMISKSILPWFGGTPAVWTICLLFFQTLLFAGYSYAHVTNTWLRPWQQAMLHICVIIVALALLRVLPDSSQQPSGDADPTTAILVLLAITIGLPYFVLSSTGPLLQAWFARSFPGRTPYRLYALSNVGSLLALLSYPFLFERQFDLAQQGKLWSAGFIAFAFLCAYAAWCVRHLDTSPVGVAGVEPKASSQAVAGLEVNDETIDQKSGGSPSARPQPPDEPPEPSATHCFLWLALPAFASVVLMATTNHISTDVAVVPLLWVVPLALYLLTFIIAFDRPSWYWPKLTAALTLVFLYPTAAIYKNNNVGWLYLYKCGMTGRSLDVLHHKLNWQTTSGDGTTAAAAASRDGPGVYVGFRSALVVNFATMFGICLLCHGQLARLRPPPRYLTTYFLMMSAGGALGGIAVSLVAPHVFKTIFEWQIAIFAAAVGAVGIILYALVSWMVEYNNGPAESGSFRLPPFVPRLLLVVMVVPTAFYVLDLVEYLFSPHRSIVYQSRNFFGALAIRENEPDNPKKRELVLLNGTTLHGSQFTAPERRGQPTSYYGTASGIGIVLNWFHANRPPGGVRIGDVGLGAGTLAAYALKFDHITFYEINPTVIEISTGEKYFTYVADARARGAYCDVRLGDARLTLQRELATESTPRSAEEQNNLQLAKGELPYHVLVLDAFSGDAVPTHLLTKEAMQIYLPHLATEANMGVDGALLVHVSNRYLDFDRVVRGAAESIGFDCVEIHNPSVDAQSINSSDWVVLTHNQALLAALAPHTAKPEADEKPPVLWTDAHSSLFEILRHPPPSARTTAPH